MEETICQWKSWIMLQNTWILSLYPNTKHMNDNVINSLHVEKMSTHLLIVTYVIIIYMDLTYNSENNHRTNCAVIQFSTCMYIHLCEWRLLIVYGCMFVSFFVSVSVFVLTYNILSSFISFCLK